MMETKTAVENMESILDVEGINGVYIGPSDLGFSYGLVPKLDRDEPEILKIYEKIVKECGKRGLYPGIHCSRRRRRGARDQHGLQARDAVERERIDDDLRQDAGGPDPQGFRRQGVRARMARSEWRVGRAAYSLFAIRHSLFANFKETPHDPSPRHPPASRRWRADRALEPAAGHGGGRRRHHGRADSGRPQGRDPADRGRRADPPLRPDHRLCHRADRAGPACPHAELRHGRFRQGLRLRRRRQADAEFRSARDLRGHPPSRRAGGDPQLYRHPHLGELQRACRRPGRRCLQEESVHRRQSAGRFSQCRRRGGADPQDRLRHDAGRAAGAAAPHARRLCAAREFFRRDRAGAGLRGQPDRRADEGAEARRPPARDGHPGSRRHPQDRGSRRRLRARGADRCQQGQARAGAGERVDGGAAMRRLRRLFRRLRQSGAGRGERSAGAAWRHRDPVGNAGDLRRRASADAPRGQPRGRREAGRR